MTPGWPERTLERLAWFAAFSLALWVLLEVLEAIHGG